MPSSHAWSGYCRGRPRAFSPRFMDKYWIKSFLCVHPATVKLELGPALQRDQAWMSARCTQTLNTLVQYDSIEKRCMIV